MSEEQAEYKTEQTIFRVTKSKDNPFVMIDRRPLEKPYISWKAKGLLAYLLSRPDNWTINFGDLVKRSTDGEHATRAAAKELEKAGHLQVEKERDRKGRIIKWTYTVYEQPLCGFQDVGNPDIDNCHINDTDIKETKEIKETSNSAKRKPLKANQIPQVILFREVTRRYPSTGSQFTVITSVDKVGDRVGREATPQDLEPFYREWCDRGYNPTAVKWLSDWAVTGNIPQNGHKPQAIPQGVSAAQSWLQKRQAQNG